jgi:hypothetical protein
LEIQILFGITEISEPLHFNPRAVLFLALYFWASLARPKPQILKNGSEECASIFAAGWELAQFLCPEDGVILSKSRIFEFFLY